MIQVINRALDILEYISIDPAKPKLLGHIANDLKLNPATCANIIKTLVNRGYLEKSDIQKGYQIGKQLTHLSSEKYSYQNLIDVADIEMKNITKQLNEKCLLAVLKGDKRKIIHKNKIIIISKKNS